jgi:hypothetical protein
MSGRVDEATDDIPRPMGGFLVGAGACATRLDELGIGVGSLSNVKGRL